MKKENPTHILTLNEIDYDMHLNEFEEDKLIKKLFTLPYEWTLKNLKTQERWLNGDYNVYKQYTS
tara:strand:+ start:2122 stop:2316 length:195 start_codon:yes stop_codon:yes gene_type:complete